MHACAWLQFPAGLGHILESPEPAVVPLGANASFTCSAVGSVFWAINSGQVQSLSQVQHLATLNIFVPLSTPSTSEVVITASLVTNGTLVECLVEEEGDVAILNRTETVLIKVYGRLKMI